jgi:hypothetical protein
MQRDGTLAPSDVSNGRIYDELLATIRGEDGLYYVGKFFSGFDRLNPRVHIPSLRWFQREMCQPDALVALRDNRSSGKTSGTTKNWPFWVWAQEPKPGTPQQGINTRIGIVAPKKTIAGYNFIADIDARWQSNTPGMKTYKKLCPWVRPNPRYWSLQQGLKLLRDEEGGEPSLMPLGMESIATSAHFHMLFCDDPIHEQNYQSEILVRQCVNWVYLSFNLTLPEHGSRAFIGNFWRTGDVQDQLRPSNPKFTNVKVWERGLITCPQCVTNRFPLDVPATETEPAKLHECGDDYFPCALLDVRADENGKRVLVDPDPSIIDLTRESVPQYQYATQNLNRPASAETLHLRREWLKFYNWHYSPDGEKALLLPVPVRTATDALKDGSERYMNQHNHGGTSEIVPLHEFDVYILIDPASSESAGEGRARFAFTVVGKHKFAPRIVLLEEYAKNAAQHVHLHAILDAYEQWRPYIKKIAYESVAYQSTLRDALLTTAHEIRRMSYLTENDIVPLPRLRSEAAQEDRIKYALMPMMEAGNLYIRRDHRLFIGEIGTFGIRGAVRDLLDSLSNGPRVWGTVKDRKYSGSAGAVIESARRRSESAGKAGY